MLRHHATRHRRVYLLIGCLTVFVLTCTMPAAASSLAIVEPFRDFIDAVTGPIAVSLGILVLVAMGIALGFGRVDFQQFAVTGAVTILLLGLVFLARPFLHDLFGTPSTPAAALLGF